MANKDMADAVERSQATLYKNETEVSNRLKAIINQAELTLESQLRRSWEKYQESGKLGQLTPAIQARAIMLELMPEMSMLDRKAYNEAKTRLAGVLDESFSEGQSLGDSLLKMADEKVVKQTSGLPKVALEALATNAVNNLSRYTSDFKERAIGIIGAGLASNQGVAPVTRNLREALGLTQSKAEQLVRTESLSATNSGAIKVYKDNGVDLYQFLATSYDRRTCQWCVNRNLMVYQLGQSQPPIHPGCRCTAMPFKREWIDAGIYDMDWAVDYRQSSLDALRANGIQPNSGLSPFERMNGVLQPPKPYWVPGEDLPSVKGSGSRKSKTSDKPSNDEDIATKKFEWTRHPLANGKTVEVKVADLDRAWKTDRITKDTGIGKRYEEATKFLKEHTKVNMSEISVNKDGSIVFTDGRHRFAVLRDSGRETIKVVMRFPKNWDK